MNIDFDGPTSTTNAHTLRQVIEALLERIQARLGVQAVCLPVLCADHRRVGIYSQVVADELASLFGRMNARLERVTALVARSNATLSLQLERIVREAKNPRRRVYYDVVPALEFLSLSLGPNEIDRARLFLNEPLT